LVVGAVLVQFRTMAGMTVARARDRWVDAGRLFPDKFGRKVNPPADRKTWRALLDEAGVRRLRTSTGWMSTADRDG
jgi:hypothetical protein